MSEEIEEEKRREEKRRGSDPDRKAEEDRKGLGADQSSYKSLLLDMTCYHSSITLNKGFGWLELTF